MISIVKATKNDYEAIARIGRSAVRDAHGSSCDVKDMDEYINKHYADEAIIAELNNADNVYHVINYNGKTVGFSKIILNAAHANVSVDNVTKLDRIYILKEFYNLKLGYELLKYNIDFCVEHGQVGIWLFTWIGNEKAIRFYEKIGFVIIGSHSFKVSENHSNLNHQMYLDLVNMN